MLPDGRRTCGFGPPFKGGSDCRTGRLACGTCRPFAGAGRKSTRGRSTMSAAWPSCWKSSAGSAGPGGRALFSVVFRARGGAGSWVRGGAVMWKPPRRPGRPRRPVDLYCCFTRAEEVGFVGAAGLARTNILPRRAKLISIEMSRELPGKADQGKGFVIRAGYRASLFDPGLVGFMIWIARRMQAARKTFQFQTAILDGGTCEATLFNAMGGCAAGVALPLRNYHNQAPDGHIAPECIDMHDLNCLVDFLDELAGQMRNWGQDRRALRSRLDRNFRTWRKYL